ncbi:MAG: hypothetical protein HeimC2_38090 [Candidatus Heimdallarchaeota archaeon LC_2]|nr:MAG: hypothetical protein HeimC2_38090 [Candidatus Heimdallarchaeota archaeon LC_2]
MEEHIIPTDKSLKSYWFFISGQLVSLFGSSVVQFAIIWWLTVTSKADPNYENRTGTILGLASVAGFAPFVITSLFAGVLVDRWNRKLVIAIADAFQALFTGILMILFYYDKAELVYVLLILAVRSVAQGFHSPATAAIIPLLVPKNKLTKVNSVENIFNSTVSLIGPIVGAVLVEVIGVENMAAILWIDIITFIIAVFPVLIISIPDITKKKREQKENSFSSEFKEGVSFIKNQDGLLSLLTTFTVLNIMITPVFVLLPLVIIDPSLINGNASTLAIFMVITQIGAIIGAFKLTKGQLFHTNAKGVAFGQALLYVGMFTIIVSLIMSNVYILYLGGFINGIGLPISNVPSQTIWQSVVPPELQGRVMSVRMAIAWTMIPVSQLVGGIISDIIGPIKLFTGALFIGLSFLIFAWFMTGFSRVEITLGLSDPVLDERIPDKSDTPLSSN